MARVLLEAYTLQPGPDPCDWDEVERTLTGAIEVGGRPSEMQTSNGLVSFLPGRTCMPDRGTWRKPATCFPRRAPVAQDWPFPPAESAVLWGEAMLAAAEEQWAEALATFESLVEVYAKGGMRWKRARGSGRLGRGPPSRGGVENLAERTDTAP